MNADMRRQDRKLSDEETITLLDECEYGVLCTVCTDGTPYGVPMNFARVENSLYMHCSNAGGLRLTNISHNTSASFTVINHVELLSDKFSTKYCSAIAFGTAHIVADVNEKKSALTALIQKYSPDFMEKGLAYIERAHEETCVIRLDIDSVSGKGRKN